MKLTLTFTLLTIASLGALSQSNRFVTANHNGPAPKLVVAMPKHALKAQSFKVDNASSKLTWLAKKAAGEHSGNVKVSEGNFVIDGTTLKSGSFTIDTKSITVTDVTDATTNGKLLGHLKSEDFFSTEKFPTSTFVITSAKKASGNKYNLIGKLTIKGITNEVSFPAAIDVAGKKLTAKAKITIDRTKYDIKFRSKNFFENLGDKVIYDDFDIDVALVANAG